MSFWKKAALFDQKLHDFRQKSGTLEKLLREFCPKLTEYFSKLPYYFPKLAAVQPDFAARLCRLPKQESGWIEYKNLQFD